MLSIFDFVSEYFVVYIFLIFTSFLNVVAPVSFSTIQNPILAFFMDPQRSVGVGAFMMFFGGMHRVYLFRKEIFSDGYNIKVVKSMLPFTIVGAIAGGTLVSYLNMKLLAFIVVIVSVNFIYKTIKQIIQNKKIEPKNNKFGSGVVALFTGFLQASGMPGADLRNNYLRTVLSEISVRATGTILGFINFFISGTIIFLHNKMNSKDILFILTLIPFLLVAQIYGKKLLHKMTDRHAKMVAVSLSIIGVVLLIYKYLL